MRTQTIRQSDDPFVEVGAVTIEGRTFSALGAAEVDGVLLAYHTGDVVTSWDGAVVFGRVIRSRDYHAPGFGGPIRMRSLRVRRPDGTVWAGRYGFDWRQSVRLRGVR